MVLNDDYKNGIKLLLKASKKENFPIRKYKWIPYYSNELAKENLCERFWKNTIEQKRLPRIEECNSIYDTFYVRGSALFIWEFTPEGHEFWDLGLHKAFDVKKIAVSFKKLGWL